MIDPFQAAVDKLPPAQALLSCQRFIPLLSAISTSVTPIDSLDSLVGFYLSLLTMTGAAEPSKLNALHILLPSISWSRAAVAVAAPSPPISAPTLDFIFRLYSLALQSLSSNPSSVQYLRYVCSSYYSAYLSVFSACIICNRGSALASRQGRAADERELVRALEKAAVPMEIASFIPSLAAVPTSASQLYSALVGMTDAALLNTLRQAEVRDMP